MIAVIVPIGDPRLYGYGNVLSACLQSIDDFADLTILVQSQPAISALQPYALNLRNVKVISNSQTWFKDDIYDGKLIDRNLFYGAETARLAGADIIIYFSSNWYIPEGSQAGLRKYCNEITDFGYLYRGDQLANRLFSASKRLPMIVRAEADIHYLFSADKLINSNWKHDVKRGDYSKYDDIMIVDVPFEITRQDLTDKQNFTRCYTDVLPKRDPTFKWDYWHNYYSIRFAVKRPCHYPLDKYGQIIAANSKPEYLSHLFLKELSYATA